ncbi:MAG: hypothetical protein J6Y82_05740 [Bacteroidales bacterium]|nr:hypothetical protein [Bacteroidales bacterium]
MKSTFIRLLTCGTLIACIATSCSKSLPHTVDFYHWKTTYEVGPVAKEYMSDLQSENIYLHVFDVVKKNGEIIPEAKIAPFDFDTLTAQNIVPIVFITNNVFNDSNDDYEALANRILSLTNTIFYRNGIGMRGLYTELQIDYDWTKSTRDNYFAFLETLKEKAANYNQTPVTITCTIRLHQIKDADIMGVPPVEKGYLMCYATTNPTDGMDSNSILDVDLLKNYTQNIDTYPLMLDFDLPLFSWGVVTNHMGKTRLINGLSTADVSTDAFKKIGDNKYEVVEDGFVHSLYLNKGFTVEIEEITPSILDKAKSYLDDKLKRDYHIVYFQISDGFLKRFTIDDLK